MKSFKEYIKESYNERKYWLSPSGKFFKTDDHEDFAFNNIVDSDLIMQEYPEYGQEDTIDNENGRGKIFDISKEKGWIPIHIENKIIYFRQPWKNLPYHIKSVIKNFAIENNYELMDYYSQFQRKIEK